MDVMHQITQRFASLIQHVSGLGYDGRFTLRMGMEDVVKYAEFLLRPLPQGAANDTSLAHALEHCQKGWERAMEQVFPDAQERGEAEHTMRGWLARSRHVAPAEVGAYLASITANLRLQRSA